LGLLERFRAGDRRPELMVKSFVAVSGLLEFDLSNMPDWRSGDSRFLSGAKPDPRLRPREQHRHRIAVANLGDSAEARLQLGVLFKRKRYGQRRRELACVRDRSAA
jgi:hypothetical protein